MCATKIVHLLFAGLLILLTAPAVIPGQAAGTRAAPCDGNQSGPIFSQTGASEEAVGAFLVTLQKAVAADDRRKVASMIRYPIVARAGGRSLLFKTPTSLVASYDLIFTARLKKTIAETRKECLFTNSQGAMIHDGEIWFNAFQTRTLKIVTINVPAGEGKAARPTRKALHVHPKVFSLIESWESDSAYPIVTEINLDAIAENHNQFDPGAVKQDGEWIRCDAEEGKGFLRYRSLEAAGNRHTVEFQDNGGGTLTTAAVIEFIVEKRALRKDGKLKFVRVLRVLSYSRR